MNHHTLSRLLRLRQVQSDVAKVVLVRANQNKQLAEEESIRRADVLRSMQLPDREEAATWLAVAAARRSAAIAVRDSLELVRVSASEVDDAAAEWNRARAAARGLERLEERQQEVRRRDELARDQREQDDRSATRSVAAAADAGEELR